MNVITLFKVFFHLQILHLAEQGRSPALPVDHFINALNLVVNVYQTSCDRKVPGSKRPHENISIYLYTLHDNMDFGALIGKIASPDAHAVFRITVISCDS